MNQLNQMGVKFDLYDKVKEVMTQWNNLGKSTKRRNHEFFGDVLKLGQ